MALGALEVIEAAGRAGEIAVAGFDGQPQVLTAVHAGRLSATVDWLACTIGRTAADAVERLLRGETILPVITIPSKPMTKRNPIDSARQIVNIMSGLFHSLMETARRDGAFRRI